MAPRRSELDDTALAQLSLRYRRRLLEAIKHAGGGHTGGSLSCVDILTVLYHRILRVSPETFSAPARDRYIQSKGHSVEALFAVLAGRGFFPDAELDTLGQAGSHFVGHPTRKVPGVEHNTGGLGHGLSFGVGQAIAGRLDGADFRVFVLLGDGELAEGSNWEAALSAAHYKLSNLTAIVDCNSLQITGRTKDVMGLEPLADKFRAFGWAAREVNGHSFAELTSALEKPLEPERPSAVIARTIKGRGVSFMEDAGVWHHRVPTDAEFEKAIAELDAALAKLGGGH